MTSSKHIIGHGGARPGAGRKPDGDVPASELVAFRLTPIQREQLLALQEGNTVHRIAKALVLRALEAKEVDI